MRRRLLNVLTLLSLLACVAVVVLWVRSFARFEAFVFRPDPDGGRHYSIVSDSGTVCVASRVEAVVPEPAVWEHHTSAAGALTPFANSTGFLYRWTDRLFIVGVPHPFLCLLALLPVGARVWRAGRKRAARPRSCAACGYDLTGNVSGVCPECGTAKA